MIIILERRLAMTRTDHNGLAHAQRRIHIDELKAEVQQFTSGPLHAWESEGSPPEISAQFWKNVLAWERMAETTHFEQLTKDGMELPPAEDLSEVAISIKLWDLIRGLARRQVYLSQTNHLSDRELYDRLQSDLLREPVKDFPVDSGWTCHLDILGGYGEEEIQLYQKYYASEADRRRWAKEWPEDAMPKHVDPPYDRDRFLPSPRE
jgi:hypothetical protein